jgi:hypothetical protein
MIKLLSPLVFSILLISCGNRGMNDQDTTGTHESGLINDFIIMAYSGPPLEEVTLERYQEIADAGIEYLVPGNGTFNLEQNLKAMDLAEQVGIGIIPIDMRLIPFALKPDVSIDTAVIIQIARDYKDQPAFEGYFVKDEPKISMYPALKKIADIFHSIDPVNESLCCLFPNYGTLTQFGVEDYRTYITSFIEIVEPGLLAYDSYALRHEVTLYDDWFSNLALVREETQKADIPYLVFIQSHGVEEGLRVPDRAEILWQVNTAVSYGARGIGWLSYWTPETGLGLPHVEGAAPPLIEHYYNGPIDIEGNRTEIYDYVREANLYLKKAGKGLLGWDNTDVARYEDGNMVQGGSSPVVSLKGEEANIIIGTYRKDDRARLVVSNASCEEPTIFALNLAAEWELDQVFTLIDAHPSSQYGSLIEWSMKPGGSVIIEVTKSP